MISFLTLRDFKCFSLVEQDLGSINVLAGANGAGKSTFIQAILLLFQSVQSGALKRDLVQLNGPFVQLGTGKEVLYRRSEADDFHIALRIGEFELVARALVSSTGTDVAVSDHSLPAITFPHSSAWDVLEAGLLYLSADRLGPQSWYPVDLAGSLGNPIGSRGEFAPLLLARSKTDGIRNVILLLEDEGGHVFPDVGTQFNAWMRRLFPGFDARAERLERVDAVRLGVALQRQIGEPDYSRPANIGFGVSVAFPIVLAGLLAKPGDVLILENPEAHLHPMAQSLIGEFLSRVAAGGIQVFVETHSDHVVNGMRIAHRNGVLPAEDMRFFAFLRSDQYGSHRIERIALTDSSEFIAPPESFFDQADRDLRIIYGI